MRGRLRLGRLAGVVAGGVLAVPICIIGLANDRNGWKIAVCCAVAAGTLAIANLVPATQSRWLRATVIGIVSGVCFLCIDLQWSSYSTAGAVGQVVMFGAFMGFFLTRKRDSARRA